MTSMSGHTQKRVARLIGIPAGIAVSACVLMLVGDYALACWNVPDDLERVDTLREAAEKDMAAIKPWRDELDRQTDVSLLRATRVTVATYVLIVAATLFLIGAKWSMVLNKPRAPTTARIAEDRSPRVRKSRKRDRPSSSTSPASPEESSTSSTSISLPVLQSDDVAAVDLRSIDTLVEKHGRAADAAIPLLHALQIEHRYLPEEALKRVCERSEITPAQIAGVASFYAHFRSTPAGKHIVKVCRGTACHVAGAETITDEVRRVVGLSPGEDTDAQRNFTVEEVACLGCCTLAPVVQIDEHTYGHLSPDMVPDMLEDCQTADTNGNASSHRALTIWADSGAASVGEIRIGLGSCCIAGGSGKVYEALEQAVEATGSPITIKRVGCVGMCYQTPLVELVIPGEPRSLYTGVSAEQVGPIVRRHFRSRGLTRRLVRTASAVFGNVKRDGEATTITRRAVNVRDPQVAEFLDRQKHIATEHFGKLDPTDLDEYIAHDGFVALKRCVTELTPQSVIDEVKDSGLRGRGGAGFPTGVKWDLMSKTAGDVKYVICNGDEGDPGAFMDRMLMESFPYRIIEGLSIAAYAVGAQSGYFYIRAEYPLAVERIREALDACRKRGFLGRNIFGTGIDLDFKIMEGAGAFVCGEETALIASIEGRRGMPTLRPPFPVERGLWGKPTLVGNVESLATVPWIFRNGAEALAALGTESSRGTKVFSLAGKIRRGGLIEVPMGITVREIVEDIGGGIKNGRAFKAVQIGGPSGGCIPESLADTPVDYEALIGAGAIMGSGGLVVLDDTDCMVDIARYFLTFTQDQSCGKCTYCRIGTRKMLDILDRLCTGGGRTGDLEVLELLAGHVHRGSLCGLGKTAPTPVLSTLRYFRDEYEAHIAGRCPAGKCKELITYRVTDKCVGCTICSQNCPVDAIEYRPYETHEIDSEKCTRCDICRVACPEVAIVVE